MTFLALFGNVWFRRAALVAAAVLAFFVLRQHFVNEGKLQGHAAAGQELKVETEKQVSDARALYLSQAQGLNAVIDQYKQQAAQAQGRADIAFTLVSAFSQQRQTASTNVAKVDDSHMHGYVVTSLALRPPGDATACYTPLEEREIAARVVDDPLCRKEVAAGAEGVKQQTDAIAGIKAELAGMQQKLDDLAGYTGKVEAAYTQIYNAFPRKRNLLLTVVTLGAAGKPRPLPFPDPRQLTGEIVKKKP